MAKTTREAHKSSFILLGSAVHGALSAYISAVMTHLVHLLKHLRLSSPMAPQSAESSVTSQLLLSACKSTEC